MTTVVKDMALTPSVFLRWVPTAFGDLDHEVTGTNVVAGTAEKGIGVATTLMALPPVFLLPIGRFVFGERITASAVLGTLVAIGGVALLFLHS